MDPTPGDKKVVGLERFQCEQGINANTTQHTAFFKQALFLHILHEFPYCFLSKRQLKKIPFTGNQNFQPKGNGIGRR